MYYVYMLRCEDDSVYTGICTDVQKRMSEHFSKDIKCAKYTKSHTAKKVEMVWSCGTKSEASKLEYRIKRLCKAKKEELIKGDKDINECFFDLSEIKYEPYKIDISKIKKQSE